MLEKQEKEKRKHYDARLCALLEDMHIQLDFIVLAGFMRKLSAVFVDYTSSKATPIINLHPALPGEYPGINAIERAFTDYQQGKLERSGVMLHLSLIHI